MSGPDQLKPVASLPLRGVRVVEVASNVAGPYAASILGTLGAEVVKVERPGGGDDARGWGPPFWMDSATVFEAMNHGKKSVAVDLKDESGRAWLREYTAQCDVLVHNMRPGVMESLGLSSGELRSTNPRLIYCTLGAFGHKGPLSSKPGYEPILQAFSGMFSINGVPEQPGVRVGFQALDLGTGVWGALGCLAALYQRSLTGVGCDVDGSLFETALGWLQIPLAGFHADGQQPQRHPSGNPAVVVFQSFAVSDGEILIAAANNRLFVKLVRAIGLPELAADPRFLTNALRVQNKEVLLPLLEAVLRLRSMVHWFEVLEAAGVPCSPIHDFAQVLAQPQTKAIGILQEAPQSGLPLVGLPISFDGLRPAVVGRAPRLGQHTEEVMGSHPKQ